MDEAAEVCLTVDTFTMKRLNVKFNLVSGVSAFIHASFLAVCLIPASPAGPAAPRPQTHPSWRPPLRSPQPPVRAEEPRGRAEVPRCTPTWYPEKTEEEREAESRDQSYAGVGWEVKKVTGRIAPVGDTTEAGEDHSQFYCCFGGSWFIIIENMIKAHMQDVKETFYLKQ